ncbi:hypothetical protein AYO38_10175 [bacterium SCGC AG-212-C10]|nr:hypothetical protein AYO38_10175 [bacterium SCGC AG-212-C10]
MTRIVYNSFARPAVETITEPGSAARRFHERLPDAHVTPLWALPGLAQRLGVGHVWLKDESSRMGLPSFKVLGASWATYQVCKVLLGSDPDPWPTMEDLVRRLQHIRPLKLATATDGNHGRAVARIASWLEFDAHIFVPAGTAPSRIRAIESEGATVTVVDGAYDDAVKRAAAEAGTHCVVISDTSWEDYKTIPRWVIDGYSTIFREVSATLSERQAPRPDVILVQVGVGALAAAAVAHFRARWPGSPDPGARIVGVEPETAACALESVIAGRMVTVPGPHTSAMAGMNCGTPSPVAWPAMRDGIDAFIAIADERAFQAMRLLADLGVTSGETGAAGLGALIELLEGDGAAEAREKLGIDENSSILVLSTEGATDPVLYERITGHAPAVRERAAHGDDNVREGRHDAGPRDADAEPAREAERHQPADAPGDPGPLPVPEG